MGPKGYQTCIESDGVTFQQDVIVMRGAPVGITYEDNRERVDYIST